MLIEIFIFTEIEKMKIIKSHIILLSTYIVWLNNKRLKKNIGIYNNILI